jgi:CheY-like chemotaxis protein
MALRILVVEDDAASLELISEVLSSTDVRVVPVNDSENAAALVQNDAFDGIFLDIQMPRVDGLQLTRRIRESGANKKVPIVVVTGREDRQSMQQAFAAGATFFLEKPIDRQRLLRLFRTACGAITNHHERCARVPLKTDVICEIRGMVRNGRSCNLSRSGILLEAPGLGSGEQIKLSFLLPMSASVNARGVVVRLDEQQRAGVQFTQVNAEGRDGISRLLASDAARAS